ncbi:MAG: ORF6N domain-containing protein [Acetatifactor sp.]|nr:ORF6N domain-containing protein [Acetatifactor sp.]
MVVDDKKQLLTCSAEIQNLIYCIRGKQVMIDNDLAILYQVETKNLNKAMKRNIDRFPEDFCFQLTKEENDCLRFHFGTSKEESRGGRRYMPYVYTEQGIAMLSAVLRSDIAVRVSICIMKTFVEMRKYSTHNSLILEKLNGMEQHQIKADLKQEVFEKETNERFERIFEYIETHKEENQKIFFDGQIFDAFAFMTNLVLQANKTIILIDGYVDIVTLNILAKKKTGIDVTIYTLPSARLTTMDIANFNAQYPRLSVKYTTVFHDRFIVIDGTDGYHIGASIKDAGKKCFGINKIEDIAVIKDLLQRA